MLWQILNSNIISNNFILPKWLKTTFILLFVSIYSLESKAQIVFQERLYPGVKVIKTKQFNGSAKGKYWNLKYLDDTGRIIIKKYYKGKKLLGIYSYSYNQYNDVIESHSDYSINTKEGKERNNAVYHFYKYKNGKVIEKIDSSSHSISKSISKPIAKNTYELTDSIFYKPNNYKNSVKKIIILNEEGLLFKKIEERTGFDIGIDTTTYLYYPNGYLKRRIVTRNYKPSVINTYIGSPGSDDMSWEYTFDKYGRVKKMFVIVEGKKYKIETYSYKT